MRMALEWLLPSHEVVETQSGYARTSDLRRMLGKRAGKTILLWTSGHHGIAGNEGADVCAMQVAAISDGAKPQQQQQTHQPQQRILSYKPYHHFLHIFKHTESPEDAFITYLR